MDNKIYISDENGQEVEMNILFTFENDEGNKKYVIVYPNDNEEELYAFLYDDDGNLTEVTDQEELDMVNEVISAFDEENEVA